MIITKEVNYKGHILKYEDVKNGSQIPITVKCDKCGKVFESTKRQITRNGHELCRACALSVKLSASLPVGAKYGRLTVISTKDGMAELKCDCGNVIHRKVTYIKNGQIKSCGCLQRDEAKRIASTVLIDYQYGEEHPNWKGGISPERNRIEKTKEYKTWRAEVLKKGKCEKCGSTENLQVHHICNFEDNPELRTDPSNGACLCKKCHRMFHNIYGLKRTTANQYKEFVGG